MYCLINSIFTKQQQRLVGKILMTDNILYDCLTQIIVLRPHTFYSSLMFNLNHRVLTEYNFS